jgi:hypothetical protein
MKVKYLNQKKIIAQMVYVVFKEFVLTKGYILENVQWVHKDVNFLKKNLSMPYLYYLCNLIVINLKDRFGK